MADKIIPLDNNATPANSKAGGTIAGSYKGVVAPVAKEARENNPDSNAGYKNELKSKGITEPTSDTKGYNVKSIQQAYYDGTIDKSTRDYMMADALAKFARNTGKDIGNIGAQFTGGSIDNNREGALWDSRNKELFGNKITAETAQQEGTEANIKRQNDNLDLAAKRLNNELSNLKMTTPRMWKTAVDNADKIESPILRAAVKGSATAMLDASANGKNVTTQDLIASIIGRGGNDLAKEAEKQGLSVEQYVSKSLSDMLPAIGGATTNINVNAGIESPLKDFISGSNRDYNPEAIERANQVDSGARQNGEISLSLYRNPDLAYRALVQRLDPRIVEEFGERELKNWLDAGNNNLTPTAAAELLKEIYSQYNRENLRATPINRNSRDTYEQSVNRNNAREWNPN